MFYVGIFQLFLTFVSYNYNLMAKFEIFSRNDHKWFWKLCHTAKPGLEHISTIFACLALHSIVIRIKKVKVFGAIWQRSIGSRIGGKVYPRYLKNCWGVHFMHGRHKWQYTRDHNSWLLVMDQNLTGDYFWESVVNVGVSLRNTNNETNAINATMPLFGQAIWRHIWKRTVEKSQTNATNVTIHLHIQAIWEDIWKRTVEKSQTKATNVTLLRIMQALWGIIWKFTVEKSQTNVTNVIMYPLMQAPWGYIWEHTVEKSQINATNVTMHPLMQAL